MLVSGSLTFRYLAVHYLLISIGFEFVRYMYHSLTCLPMDFSAGCNIKLARFTLEKNVEGACHLVNPRFAAVLKAASGVRRHAVDTLDDGRRCCTGSLLPELAPHAFALGATPHLPRL